MPEATITDDMVINDVIRMYPWTLPVFHRYGVDSCCGGAQTIAFVAQLHGLNLEELLSELEAAARRQAS